MPKDREAVPGAWEEGHGAADDGEDQDGAVGQVKRVLARMDGQ